MRGPRLVISVLVAALSAGVLFQAPAGAGMLSWSLAEDFSVSPNQANPNPDQYGNPDVWYFMAGRAQDTSSYALLSSFVSDAFDVDGLEQWQGPFEPGDSNAGLPAVGVAGCAGRVRVRWRAVGSGTWRADVVAVSDDVVILAGRAAGRCDRPGRRAGSRRGACRGRVLVVVSRMW